MQIANKNNVKIAKEIKLPEDKVDTRFKNDALSYLEVNLFNIEVSEYDGDSSCITLCSASDIASECEYVAATAKRLIGGKN